MLSPRTIAIVKQTVPVLQAHGETLTRHFYQRMFAGDPQVQAFFNPAHQHAGTQQRALAGAICAYAMHIDNPGALAGAVELIAHKHASLGIKAEHYPIVGKHLLGAIREVLGQAATDEVIAAWAEAYGFLADVFIEREAAIYDEHRDRHGWIGFRPFIVRRKVAESQTITSFYLHRVDDQPVPPFLPGQYLTVRVPNGRGGTTMRNYSISCAPGESCYRISVKREDAPGPEGPNGFVSHFLHRDVREGDAIEVGPPCGEFTLDVSKPGDRPLVLLSGGVGITPLLSMAHAATRQQPGRRITFIHAALNSGAQAFRVELRSLAEANRYFKLHVRYSEPCAGDVEDGRCDSVGFVDAELIESLAPRDAEFYYCGPKPFMVGVHRLLKAWGVPAERLHHEFFGPAQDLEALTPAKEPASRDGRPELAGAGA